MTGSDFVPVDTILLIGNSNFNLDILLKSSLLGQNSIVQAKSFNKIIPLDGVILTKLDSTAKGGIIFSIFKELSIPIKYICTGESIDDIEYFNPKIYLDGLLGKD